VFVRVSPSVLASPPALTVEQTVLLLDTDKAKVTDRNRAAVAHVGYGDGITVLVQPGKTLFGALMASIDVTLSWRVIPLAGRSMLGVAA